MARQPDRPLSATAYAVMGLLSFGRDLSGYDLKKWADHSLSLFFWSPATSQIYSELRRLEALGHVTSKEVPQDDLRNKRVYRLSAQGRRELTRWMSEAPVDQPMLKHPVLLRVWLGHLVDHDRLHHVISEHRERTREVLDQIDEDLKQRLADTSWEYAELILRWAQRSYRAEYDNATRLLKELDEFVRRAPSS